MQILHCKVKQYKSCLTTSSFQKIPISQNSWCLQVKKTINNTICDPSRNIKSRFYTNDSINYLPKILARRGRAELKMTYKPQLRMICVNVVRCAVGRMYLIPGSV